MLIILVPQSVLLGQNTSGFNIGGLKNLDVYKPYSPFGKEFNEKHNNVTSSTNCIYAFYTTSIDEKNSISFGGCFKSIKHKITGKFNYQMYISDPLSSSPDTTIYYLPSNLYSSSASFGVHLEYNRIIHSKKRISGLVGLSTQFYLLEFFGAHYSEQYTVPRLLMSDTPRNFFFSSANTSLHYAIEFKDKLDYESLRLKVSVGTNLYSDWDQFKRYVWVGVGAEIGIRTHKKETIVLPN